MFFYTSLAAISRLADIDGPVTLLLYDFLKLRGYTTNFRIQKHYWKILSSLS